VANFNWDSEKHPNCTFARGEIASVQTECTSVVREYQARHLATMGVVLVSTIDWRSPFETFESLSCREGLT